MRNQISAIGFIHIRHGLVSLYTTPNHITTHRERERERGGEGPRPKGNVPPTVVATAVDMIISE